MKKINVLIRLIAFVLIFVLIMIFFSNTLMVSNVQSSTSRNQVRQSINAEPDNTLDVLFLGDSTILSSIIPIKIWEEIGITSFNIGYGWAYPNEIYYDFKKTIETQSPKCVFLEASFFVDTVAVDDNTNVISNKISYFNNDLVGMFSYLFPYAKYKSTIKDRGVIENFSVKSKAINNIYKGYSLKTDVNEADQTKSDIGKVDAEFIENGEEYFNRMYNLCKKNSCELVILLSPQISDWTQEEHDLLYKLSRDYSVRFLDLNIDTENLIEGFSWLDDSSDGGTHLNYSGATKTTKTICDYLVNELGMKPTELTNEQVSKWEKDTKQFYKAIENQ